VTNSAQEKVTLTDQDDKEKSRFVIPRMYETDGVLFQRHRRRHVPDMSLNQEGPHFVTRCPNCIVSADGFNASILPADFHLSVKTVSDLENPFSHYMCFVKVKALQFRRFMPSVTAEAAKRCFSVFHDSLPGG
jgi:hypothetical protein